MKALTTTKKLALNKMTIAVLTNPEYVKGGNKTLKYTKEKRAADQTRLSTQTSTDYASNTGD